MSDIVVRQVNDLDPELMRIARPMVARWQAAVYRVAASRLQPALMAFQPGPDTPEGILQKRFQKLSDVRQKKAGERALTYVNHTPFMARLGVKKSDLETSRSVREILPDAPHSISAEQLRTAVRSRLQDLEIDGGVPPSPGTLTALRLELRRIVCVDETDGILGTEWGRDEIEIGGTILSNLSAEAGEVEKIGPFDLGSFNDNDDSRQRDFSPPKLLFELPLGPAQTYPLALYATLLAVEADQGNLSETMNSVVEKLKEETIAKIGALIGSVGGVGGMIVGLIVGWAVGKVFQVMTRAWEDDAFEPQTLEVVLLSSSASFGGRLVQPSQVVHFKGPGHYAMRYQWAVSRVPQPVVA